MSDTSKLTLQEMAQKMLQEWTPKTFTTKFYARNKKSEPVNPDHPDAVRFCFIGMSEKLFKDYHNIYDLRLAVQKIIKEKEGVNYAFVDAYNDDKTKGYPYLREILQEIAEGKAS